MTTHPPSSPGDTAVRGTQAPTYTPDGKTHRILARLAAGPATFGELVQAVYRERETSGRRRRRIRHVLAHPTGETDLVTQWGRHFTLTPASRARLDALDARSATATPTVRIFTRQEAA